MMTYIYHKDSTLWAFEGPEPIDLCKLQQQGDCEKRTHWIEKMSRYVCPCAGAEYEYNEAMSTARESALPVVNYIDVAILIGDKCYSRTLSPQIEFKKEPVALPGWGLEKVYQYRTNHWATVPKEIFDSWSAEERKRQAYRLVRSEPEKKHITLTFKSGSLWHGEYEVVNPMDIPKVYMSVNGNGLCYDALKLVDGDQITLPDGYGILIRYKVATSTKDYIMIWCTKEQYDESPGFERQIVATITLPEKPSFKEMFEKSSLFKNIEKPDNSAHGAIQTATGVSLPFVEPSESQEETYNCADCNAPLIKKRNANVRDASTLLCHSCWTETWELLFQMIREGKYEQVKEKFTITRK